MKLLKKQIIKLNATAVTVNEPPISPMSKDEIITMYVWIDGNETKEKVAGENF